MSDVIEKQDPGLGSDEQKKVHDNPGHGDDHGHPNDQKIKVFVNEKHVTLEGTRQTGLAIKKAAIAQGVNIQLDFLLSIDLGGGKTQIVGDNDPVRARPGQKFVCIADDDNS